MTMSPNPSRGTKSWRPSSAWRQSVNRRPPPQRASHLLLRDESDEVSAAPFCLALSRHFRCLLLLVQLFAASPIWRVPGSQGMIGATLGSGPGLVIIAGQCTAESTPEVFDLP